MFRKVQRLWGGWSQFARVGHLDGLAAALGARSVGP
jgi:hypothetical protein